MINPNVREKLARTVRELGKYSVLSNTLLDNLFISDEVDLNNKSALPGDIKWTEMSNPYVFNIPQKYYWIKTSFDVPETNEHQEIRLSFDTSLSGQWITLRPQGLLYLNGEMACGIDVRHIDTPVKAGHYDLYMLFYTHDVEDFFSLRASLKLIDKRVEKTYYDLSLPNQSLELLVEKDDNAFKMLPYMEKACNILDFRIPHSEAFYQSMVDCSKYLEEEFYKGACGSDLKVNVLGHSHIDVAWLWDYDQTKEKVKRTTATALRLMDEYPEYNFLASTPQLYEYLKDGAPELYSKVKQRIKEGRWEPEGGFWLECDCNLTSGESLIRQVVHGKRFFKEEFGIDSKVIWLPDVFGYSGALPQIMKKSGLEKFVTAKIGWNDTNRFPYDTFIWRGIDGSEVDAYLISTADICDPRHGIYDITYTTYCADMAPRHVLATWHRYTQKEFNQTTFMTMGWGDGGGGPTREMMEAQRRLQYGIPGIPKTHISTLKETLDEIKNNFDTSCKELRRTPMWTGELYFEFHRGTLTSVPMVKKYNRESEILLQNTETISVLNNKLLNTKEYPAELLNKHWKAVLLNQFHDVLPGSSIEKVYRDAKEMYDELFKEVRPIYSSGVDNLFNNIKGEGVAVYNPNGFEATGKILNNGKTYVVKDIPSYGYKVVNLNDLTPSNLTVEDKHLENDFFSITFNNDGSISSLFDKRNNRELVAKGASINKLVAYEDMAIEYDNWELASFHKQKAYPLDGDATFEAVKEDNRVSLIVTKHYNNSVITQTISLYNGLEYVEVHNHIEWNEKHQVLKAVFPVNLLVDSVNYEVQFGHIARNAHLNNSHDWACFESVAHKWIDASENNYGFAILNDGKYGHGAEENELSITLTKSGHYPYDGASEFIPDFTYCLMPHKGTLTDSKVIENGYVLNRPLISADISNPNGSLPSEYSYVKCLTEGVYIDTIKKAYDTEETVIRLYEGYKENKTVTLSFQDDVTSVYVSDLLENKLQKLDITNNSVTFDIKPFEIITLIVK